MLFSSRIIILLVLQNENEFCRTFFFLTQPSFVYFHCSSSDLPFHLCFSFLPPLSPNIIASCSLAIYFFILLPLHCGLSAAGHLLHHAILHLVAIACSHRRLRQCMEFLMVSFYQRFLFSVTMKCALGKWSACVYVSGLPVGFNMSILFLFYLLEAAHRVNKTLVSVGHYYPYASCPEIKVPDFQL